MSHRSTDFGVMVIYVVIHKQDDGEIQSVSVDFQNTFGYELDRVAVGLSDGSWVSRYKI